MQKLDKRVDDEDVSSSGLTKDSQELCVTGKQWQSFFIHAMNIILGPKEDRLGSLSLVFTHWLMCFAQIVERNLFGNILKLMRKHKSTKKENAY